MCNYICWQTYFFVFKEPKGAPIQQFPLYLNKRRQKLPFLTIAAISGKYCHFWQILPFLTKFIILDKVTIFCFNSPGVHLNVRIGIDVDQDKAVGFLKTATLMRELRIKIKGLFSSIYLYFFLSFVPSSIILSVLLYFFIYLFCSFLARSFFLLFVLFFLYFVRSFFWF